MAPPPPSIPAPCPHLSSYRSSSRNPFRNLRRSLRVRPLGLPSIRLDPLSHPHCPLCPSSSSPLTTSSSSSSSSSRLLACLSCGQVFCPSHASHHPISSPGHYISVDLLRAELFCCSCSDQVYDSDFDSTVSVAQSPSFPSSSSPPSNKRRRVDFKQWDPNPSQSQLIRTRSSQLHPDPSSSDRHPWGLRGLNNMGNTCFMNSVLQALLHTPPLRNYFLSDRHNRFLCARRSRKKSVNGVDLCLVCDLDQIYSAAFSGDRSPFSPAKFLYSWWRLSSDLASYEQQDAHEFFISILDRIHDNLVEDQQISNHNGQGDCCIAHRIFSGILRSDVTCTYCGFTSTTYDPCIDLSLDLDSTHLSRQTARNGEKETKQKHNQNQSGPTTLMRCLEKFTRPERLDNEQKFYCQKCKERRESLKQMSIRKLPLVLSFHVKRFEHSTIKKTLRKIDSCLQFPFALDMAAYLSSSVLRSRYGNRLLPVVENGASEAAISSGASSEFEIFAVVTHSGRLDAGHYVTYLRINDSWFKCDDAWVIKVEESIVRESQAYMLFYVQKVLCYTAGGNTGTSTGTIEPV
ncbi:ubiquitin-specific protease 22 [Carex rostrata]